MKLVFKFNDGFVFETKPSQLNEIKVDGDFLGLLQQLKTQGKPFTVTNASGQTVERNLSELKSVEVLL